MSSAGTSLTPCATIPNLVSVKNEITFFMEKVFQFSFVYIGSLFAIAAGTKSDVIKDLSESWRVGPFVVVAIGLLLLNLMYLVIACSCIFAVLKRGYFILIYGGPEQNDALPEWEAFLRAKREHFGYLSWNVDNYYLVVLYTLILMMSILLFCYGVINSNGLIRASILALGCMHAIPMWALIKTGKLNAACIEIASARTRVPARL